MAAAYLRLMVARQAALSEESVRRRQLRDASNPLDIPESLFIAHYRLSQEIFLLLRDRLRPLVPERMRHTGVPLELKMITTLSFLATGSYQKLVGSDWHSCVSQTTVSRHVKLVVSLLDALLGEYIKFPRTRRQRSKVKQGFYDKFKFPGVIGCIDGTHIAMVKPIVHEELYYNRKGYHSMNAVMICDSNFIILSICARFGGASHDAHIWQMMAMKTYIEQVRTQETVWLLGDSAFPLRPYMMTPILNAVPGSQESVYTEMHCKTRNCIERCFGILKSRWRCLLKHRVLHYTPLTTIKIIHACAVLHNIAIIARLPEPAELHVGDDLRRIAEGFHANDIYDDNLQQGQIVRHRIVANL